MSYYGFSHFNKKSSLMLEEQALNMVKRYIRPKQVFWSCVDFLVSKRVSLPSSYRISSIVISAMSKRENNLLSVIDDNLDNETKSILDALFIVEDDKRYKITLMKRFSHSTSPSKIKERVADLLYFRDLYKKIEHLYSILSLGHEGIKYYANNLIKSQVFQIHKRSHDSRYLHVISFIAFQYHKLQDNLSDVLLLVVQSFNNSAHREYKDWCYEHRKDHDRYIKSVCNYLDGDFLYILDKIRSLIDDKEMESEEKLDNISALLDKYSHSIKGVTTLKESLEKDDSELHLFELLKNRSIKLQNRVSAIVMVLDFEGDSSSIDLMEAISYFREKEGNVTNGAPLSFLNKERSNAVTLDGGFNRSLYKVFLFMDIASGLKSGVLNIKYSYKYRPLDNYMISKERWNRDKDSLLERAGLKDFSDLSSMLDNLNNSLYEGYKKSNELYLSGNNPYLTIRDDGTFVISTPKQDEEEGNDEYDQSFFPERDLVHLAEVLSTVNNYSGFVDEFKHFQHRYSKKKVTDKAVYAAIMGKGCSIGTSKIARISSQINENNLNHVVNWYFSLENIRAANDRILKLLDSIDLPNIYRKSKYGLHSSSDGQKFTARVDSLNANYSYKYFGKDQGVSVYSFIDERNLLWHSLVFSASERESAYVIDGLMHNDVVKSDIHSTDTHGYSEMIFAITYLISISYAPRIRNLKKQTLYIFKGREKGKDWKILPGRYVSDDVINETWDDILRLAATIKLRENSASAIL